MSDITEKPLPPPSIRVGVQGLPNLTDGMINGGLYVLVTETPPARFPILTASLTNALKADIVCSVVVAADPKSFIQRIESFGTTRATDAINTGQLRFFTMKDEFAKKMFQFGADRFVRELENYEIPTNSYLVFDQADELLSLHDFTLAKDQVEILQNWCLTRQVTLLLVFLRAGESQIGTLNALMDNMTGITRLAANKGSLELTFDYWQSPEGTVAARHFQLLTLDSGLYEATVNAVPQESNAELARTTDAIEIADDDFDFFYMDPDLGSLAKQMNGVWRRVDTMVGMMHATRNKRAATCILTYQRDTNLRQLAETVHTLRLGLGKYARIVVQEKQASLRYQNEALLLSLGVNLVVNRDVPSSRLPLMLDSLVGQVFTRDVDINFEAALNSVLPTQVRGYLPPSRFLREVSTILTRGETLNIPCAMVKGRPNQNASITGIMASNGLSRPGDLITADREYCYLFLNACPQPAILVTIDRILGGTAESLFDEVHFMVKREEIQAVLDALAHDATRGDLPDYSSILATTPVPPSQLPTQAESAEPVLNLSEAVAEAPKHESQPAMAAPASTPASRLIVPAQTVSTQRQAPEKRVYSYSQTPSSPAIGRSTSQRAKRSQFVAGSANVPTKPIQ